MPRLNPWDLKSPVLREETRTFTDSAQPEVELTVTLKQLDGIGISRAAERGAYYAQEHAGPSAIPLPLPDQSVVNDIPANTCTLIALLQEMEVPPPGEQPADLLWWLGISRKFPEAWLSVQLFAQELLEQGRTSLGNGSRRPVSPPASSSDTPSSTPA